MKSVNEKRILLEVWLIHAEQMSLCNFIILRKKNDLQFFKKETPTQVFSCGICETFKNSGGYF